MKDITPSRHLVRNPLLRDLRIKFLVFFTLLLLSLSGCTDELKIDMSEPEGERVTLSFLIPSKADVSEFGDLNTKSPFEGEEGNYQNIYLLAVSMYSNHVYAISLLEKLSETENVDGYKEANVQLAQGNYRFYIVGNVDQYINGLPVDQYFSSETKIKEYISHFSTDLQMTAGNLPMACETSDITLNSNNSQSGIFNINVSNTNTLKFKAHLKFLCAKVRYTILYDNREGGFSNKFQKTNVEFANEDRMPFVSNVQNSLKSEEIEIPVPNGDFNIYDNRDHWDGDRFWVVNEGVAEQWKEYGNSYDTYQNFKDMEPGFYRLEAQGFYRYGYIGPALAAHNDGTEELLAKLYISKGDGSESQESSFMSLYDVYYEADPTRDGDETGGYPNGVKGANWAFNIDKKYYNSVSYDLKEKGDLRIGVKKGQGVNGDWTCFDNFKLFYRPFYAEGNLPWGMNLERFSGKDWPTGTSSSEITTLVNAIIPFDGNDVEWEGLTTKAWQGIVYLPENLSSDKTTLNFPFTYGDLSDTKTVTLFDDNKTLERGKFFDIVIKLTDPVTLTGYEDLPSNPTTDPEDEGERTYRIYWPKSFGPGIMITGFEGANTDPEESKNLGDILTFDAYYEYEFTSSQKSGIFTFHHNNLIGGVNSNLEGNITPEVTNNDISKFVKKTVDGNKTIWVAYVSGNWGTDSSRIPEELNSGFPSIFSKEQYFDITVQQGTDNYKYFSFWTDNWKYKENDREIISLDRSSGNFRKKLIIYQGEDTESINIILSTTATGSNSTDIITYNVGDSGIKRNGSTWTIIISM